MKLTIASVAVLILTSAAVACVLVATMTPAVGFDFAITQFGPALIKALPAGLITAIFFFVSLRKRKQDRK